MYHKILVPLDGSERAEKILPHVENLAVSHQAEIILMQVVQTQVIDDGYKNIMFQESMEATEQAVKSCEAYLNELARKLRIKKFKVKTAVQTGPIVESIIDAAQKEDVDLIAMASHGRSGIGRFFYGSVAAGILHRIDRPLLIIRSHDDE